jgi:hypothetical protein
LANALEQLGNQYAADVRSLSQQVQDLSLRLDEQSSASVKRLDALTAQLEAQASDNVQLRQSLGKALGILDKKLNELAES